MDDSVRAWAKSPPTGEARVLYLLGLIDHLPQPEAEAEDDELEEVGSETVEEFLERMARTQPGE